MSHSFFVILFEPRLDSFICEASQLSRIFLPTYLDSQTVSLEHESSGLRKISHTSAERSPHTHACTQMQTLKIEADIPLTLVNAPHPRQSDLHIFNVLFSPFCYPSLSFSFFSVLCETVYFLIGILRRACRAYWEGAFCVWKAGGKKQTKKIWTIVVIRDFGWATTSAPPTPPSAPTFCASQVFQGTVMVSIWPARRGEKGIESLGGIA